MNIHKPNDPAPSRVDRFKGNVPELESRFLPAFPSYGAVVYAGSWSALTNSPKIPPASKNNKGLYFDVVEAGTTEIGSVNEWEVGDWILSDGEKWVQVKTKGDGGGDTPSGDSVTIGNGTKAYGEHSVAIGTSAVTGWEPEPEDGNNATAVGAASEAQGDNSVALGGSDPDPEYPNGPKAFGRNSVAIGAGTTAHGNNGIAIGIGDDDPEASYPANQSASAGDHSVAIGQSAGANAPSGTAVGFASGANGENNTAVGREAGANGGQNNTAVGRNAQANYDSGTAVGHSASASGDNTVAVGRSSEAYGDGATAVGNEAVASAISGSVSIGKGSYSSGSDSVAIGDADAFANDAVAIGKGSAANSARSVALGGGNAASEDCIAIGAGADTGPAETIAIGKNATAYMPNTVAIGGQATYPNQFQFGNRHAEFQNTDDPGSPAEGSGRFFFRDNEGVQEFVIRFGNGKTVVLADDIE